MTDGVHACRNPAAVGSQADDSGGVVPGCSPAHATTERIGRRQRTTIALSATAVGRR